MDKKAKKIVIKARRSVFSELVGNNSSKYFGEGYDFAELREYQSGDDIKKIDWNITAKLKKPYIKVFHAERELNISIVNILNGSLYFGTSKFKIDTAAEISAILGFSAIKQSDPYTSYIANDELILNTKKSKNIFSINKMVENILNYNLIGKKTDFKTISSKLFSTLKKRSLIYLIGDYFQIAELDLKLLSKKHEVVVIIVRDRFEEHPQSLGNTFLIDPESKNSFEGNISARSVKKYEKIVKENDHKLLLHLQKCAIRYIKIYTDEEPIKKLLKL